MRTLGGVLGGESSLGDEGEGHVVRLTAEFEIGDFGRSVARLVRGEHQQTDDNWRHRAVTPNSLA
ncbi:MAG: hypothetical protein QGH76_00495 [Phycisphaerales bacterium]|nr:hypothetical protein [Phycisphaerales bacterium]